MTDQPFALLIHDHPEPFGTLQALLKGHSLALWNINGGGAVEDYITRFKPTLIFVDLPIWNRSSADIINYAGRVDPAPNVIVVGSKPDIEMYVSAIERGAFSFIAYPFTHEGLRQTVNTALADVQDRKQVLSRPTSRNFNSGAWLSPDPGRASALQNHPGRRSADSLAAEEEH